MVAPGNTQTVTKLQLDCAREFVLRMVWCAWVVARLVKVFAHTHVKFIDLFSCDAHAKAGHCFNQLMAEDKQFTAKILQNTCLDYQDFFCKVLPPIPIAYGIIPLMFVPHTVPDHFHHLGFLHTMTLKVFGAHWRKSSRSVLPP